MKALKCEYCGGAIDRNTISCPFCGTDYINDNETVDTASEEDARTERKAYQDYGRKLFSNRYRKFLRG